MSPSFEATPLPPAIPPIPAARIAPRPAREDRHPAHGRQGAPERVGKVREGAALEAADRLTRAVVTITQHLEPAVPAGLARTLREAAVMAQAGTTAACRADDPVRALRGVAATDHSLQRLGVWLDLARRFGDLPLDEAMELLEAQSRLRVVLAVVSDRWRRTGDLRGGPSHAAWSSLGPTSPVAARGAGGAA